MADETADTPDAAQDLVAGAFRRVREVSKKRFGAVPDLAAPEVVRRTKRKGWKASKGIPTGFDGRRKPPPDRTAALGNVLDSEFQRLHWGKRLASGKVIAHWDTYVGEKVAEHTQVARVRGSIVEVDCDSTAWATNLRLAQSHILRKIAADVGPNVITELKIRGPRAPHNWQHGPLHVKGRGPRDTYG